ncbi:hypothetical protein [Actinomycetospora sp. NBC_00405]|uniref:hypothetical protein n=1 Tax=Actinomycetospora sp. NBC_00405 TaxID=2975952 RepID=UPI002E1C8982
MTEEAQAQAQGEQDAAMALAEEDRWQIVAAACSPCIRLRSGSRERTDARTSPARPPSSGTAR